MQETRQRKKTPSVRFFYGYTIVAASALILIVMHGSGSSFGVFFTAFQEQFGWNRASISAASSIGFFLTGLFSIFAGRLNDRIGPRFTITIAAFIIASGYFLMSHIQSMWQLYLFYGVIVALGNSGGDMALLPTVARWFVKRRSLMSSMVKTGTGIGMFLIPLLAAWLITRFDWRVAYTVISIMDLAVIFSLSWLLKKEPADIGLRPLGEEEAAIAAHGKPMINLRLNEILHTRQFWLLCGTYFLIWYATQSIMIHIAPHAVDTGFSVSSAASIVSMIGGFSILGRLTMGNAGDRIGTRKALLLCYAVLLAALTWLQFAHQPWTLYVFAPVYGFAHGSFFAIVSPLVADLFGIKAHGSALGILFFVGMTGGAISPIITGRIYDVNHSYQVGFAIMLGVAVVGLVLATLIKPLKQPQN
jgi:MFS family permease